MWESVGQFHFSKHFFFVLRGERRRERKSDQFRLGDLFYSSVSVSFPFFKNTVFPEFIAHSGGETRGERDVVWRGHWGVTLFSKFPICNYHAEEGEGEKEKKPIRRKS